MKKTVLLFMAALAIAGNAAAQSDTSKSKSGSDTAIQAPVSNLPDHLKDATSATIKPKHYLPVLGGYTTADGTINVNISVDEQNAGIVWIEGLPQGKLKGLLKKAPATYKIPTQKSATGKAVTEGTLIYDVDTKTLKLCTGCGYKDADPAATLTATKGIKVWQLNKAETSFEQVQQ